MHAAKLIIVEGLPGLGKSTTAQHIAIALERRRVSCRWYYEADHENPVSGFYEPQFFGSPPEFVAAQEKRWRAFAHECRKRDYITILESSLFQETIFGLLQYNVPLAEIRHFVQDVIAIIADLSPIVVYLVHEKPAVAVRQLCEMRGPSLEDLYVERNDDSPFARRRNLHGFLGLASFWAEYKLLTDQLYDELRFRKLRLNVTHGHVPEHEARIAEFLGLPGETEVPVSHEYLERFTGAYAYRLRHETRSFEIAAREDTLVARDCPCLWPENRLLPRELNSFYPESWPGVVVFDESESGRISAMCVEGIGGGGVIRFDKVL